MNEPKKNLSDLKIDKSWTLFLDRDGVISRKLENDYVKKWSEFEFLPAVLESLEILAETFGNIMVVTNQRGIGRKLMTTEDLKLIHRQMLQDIEKAGGRIDAIYFCPHNLEDNCDCRKPKTGMGLQAKKDFPGINFQKSIMVGDADIDMEFGRQLGMATVLVAQDKKARDALLQPADFVFERLYEFASQCKTG